MKDAYYFGHDANAFTDPKIMRLRASLGLEGYGFYFAILELMRNEKDYILDIEDMDFLFFHLGIDQAKLKQMLSKCLAVGLFKQEGSKLFSDSFLVRMVEVDKIRAKRREAGRKGGKAKQSLSKAKAKPKQNASTKGKESKEEKTKEKVIKPQEANTNIIIEYLNTKTGKHFRSANKLLARFNDGYTVDDAKKVIDNKCSQWLNDEKMKGFLRPDTLFSEKFDGYLNEVVAKTEADKASEWLENFSGGR